jgi:fructose transport system substrate-binding protein
MNMRVEATLFVLMAGLLAGCGSGAGTGGYTGSDAGPDQVGAATTLIGVVTKTDDNPFFIRIREAAITAANQWRGAKIIARSGRYDGDNDGQVAAVNDLLAQRVKGILISPSSSTGIVEVLRKAKAQGVLVIALDSPTTPPDVPDATFATNNVDAGRKVGSYLRGALGADPARLAMLDASPGSVLNDQRHEGFLAGFVPKAGELLESVPTNGDAAKAEQAMTQLLARHPDVNAVYAANEPAAQGAYDALLRAGATSRVKLATIDGSCPGVLAVRAGRYAADVMQFPTAMATAGVNAVMNFATRNTRPASGVRDTGSDVVAAQSLAVSPSRNVDWGLQHCWG